MKFPEFLKTSKAGCCRATFRSIPINLIRVSTKLQNAQISSVTLHKSDFATVALPAILKVFGTITRKIYDGVGFQMVKGGRLESSNCKKNSAKDVLK